MNLYKNKVGRPSNELLRKRKNIKIFSIALVAVVVIIGIWFSANKLFNLSGKNKNANLFGMDVQVTGDGRGFAVGNKRYLSGNWASATSIANKTIFVNSDGKTKLKIKITLPSNFFKMQMGGAKWYGVSKFNTSTNKDEDVYPPRQLGMSSSTDFTAVKDRRGQITHYTRTETIQITKSTKNIKVKLIDMGSPKLSKYVTINTSTLPEVIMTSASNANSQGIVTLSSSKNNNTNVTIKNPSKSTVYYRWLEYDNFNNKNPKVSKCSQINSDVSFKKPVNISGSNPQYSATIRFYTSKSACNIDSRGTLTNPSTGGVRTRYFMPSGETIKYQLKKVYNAGDNWIRIAFDYDDLKAKIGKQTYKICFNYALSYGTYIINNGKSYVKPNSNVSKHYGAAGGEADSYKQMYNIIKSKINQGIPVSIHVGNNSSEHWVLVTGYKDAKITSDVEQIKEINGVKRQGVNLRPYLYVLDPYDLKYGIMANDNLAAWFYGDERYITW